MSKKKSFNGISFSLFELKANEFGGYGFSILNMYYNSVSWVTHSHGGPVFSINWNLHREQGGKEYKLWICFFFMGFTAIRWVVQPKQPKCLYCYDRYAKPEYGLYCSKDCKDWDEDNNENH